MQNYFRYKSCCRAHTEITLSQDFVQIQNLLKCIKNAQDYDGRHLCTEFQRLPVGSQYTDYYDFIHEPIDLETIENRRYASVKDLCHDLDLMLNNACVYYESDSRIYRVSHQLSLIDDQNHLNIYSLSYFRNCNCYGQNSLKLRLILINERRALLDHEHNVALLVQNLLWTLFIETFNRQVDSSFFS